MAASSSGIRLGKAFIEVSLDTTLMKRYLGDTKRALQDLGAFSMKIGAGLAAAGGSILAPLTSVFTMAAERGRDVQSLAEQFGMTTESVSGLAAGFESAGISFEQFSSILTDLSGKLLNNDELLQQLGLNTYRLARIPIDQALEQVADQFARMTNPMQRAQLASQVFGSEWRKLMPYLKDGAAGIRRLREEGAGLELDPETARRGTATMKGLNQIWTQFRYTLLEVGSALLPTTETIKAVVTWVKSAGAGVRDFIKENKSTIITVAAVAAGLVVAGTALIGFGAAAASVVSIISLIGTVASGISAAFALWPVLLGAAAAGIAGYFASQTQTGQDSLNSLKAGFLELKDTAVSTWQGVGDAFQKGDLSLGLRIAVAGMQLAWAQFVSNMTYLWGGFKSVFLDTWRDAVMSFKLLSVDLANGLMKVLGPPIAILLDGVAKIVKQINEAKAAGITETANDIRDLGSDERAESTKAKIRAERAKQRRESDAARSADEMSSDKEVSRLSAVLAELKKQAAAAPAPAGEAAISPAMFGGLSSQSSAMNLGSAAKGGFISSVAAQQFGVGDKTQMIVDRLDKMIQNTDKLPEVGTKIDELNRSLRVS